MSTDVAIIVEGNTLDIEEPSAAPIYQNMLDIADGTIKPWGMSFNPLGTTTTVNWTHLAPTYAIGWAQDADYNLHRIAIVDLDNTDARTAVKVAGYVNGLIDIFE